MNNLDELVPLVERALDQVQANGGKKNVSLIKAEIELAASVTWEPGIGVKFDFFFPVEVSGKAERETAQTLA